MLNWICARKRYRPAKAAFSTWLFTIARNVATDFYRRRRPTVLLSAFSQRADGTSVREAVQGRDELARLGALLAGLPPRERYGAGLTSRSTVRLTGLGEQVVRT